MKSLNLIPKISLWALLIWGIAATAFFFIGMKPDVLEVVSDGSAMQSSSYTNMYLFTNYTYMGLVLAVTLVFVLVGYVSLWMHDWKKALITTIVVLAMVLLFVVCWSLGSGDKIEIVGYDGTDNEGFWARLSDMMIFATYALMGATLLTIVCGWVYTLLKK